MGHGWRTHLAIAMLLAAATIALTWPLATSLTTHLPAYPRIPDDDLLVNIWSFWWTRASVLEGRGDYFFSRDLFHPEGATLTLTAHAPVASLIALPVLAVVPGLAGLKLAWNLNVLLTFWLSGLAAYALAFRVTRAPWPAFVAALAFAFSPYRYDHLRHVNLSGTQWLPLVFLAVLARIEGGAWKSALGLGFSAALVAGSSLTYAAQLPLFVALFVATWAGMQPKPVEALRSALLSLVLPGALAVALAMPAIWPAFLDMATLAFETPIWEDPASFAFPIEGFVVPPLHPYLGLSALLLGVYALVRARAEAAPWAVVAFSGLLLAPGPVLKTLNGLTSIPLPYAIVRYFPGLGQNRFTERFMVFWWVGAVVLVALALRKVPRSVCLLAGLAILIEMRHAPLPLENPPVPPVYAKLAEAPAGWPVYEWPATYHSNRWFMYYQMIHERPLCQGLLSRRPLLSYQLEDVDAALALPHLVLVVHKDLEKEAHGQHRKKLEVLRLRYDAKPFYEDAATKAELLTLRASGTSPPR
jgi:hypothetical protein